MRYALQEDKFYYGDVLKQTDVKIKSLLTPDCGASVLEEKVLKHSTIVYSFSLSQTLWLLFFER